MQPTLLGLLLLPLCVCFMGNPVRLMQLALFASIFEAGAALVVGGGLGVPVAMIPGLLFLSYMTLQYLLGMRYPGERIVFWASMPLLMLLGYALLGAVLLPDAFQGQVMVWTQKPSILSLDAPTPLAPDGSGYNQCIYLAMNIVITVAGALFMSRRAIPYRKILGAYMLGAYVVVALCAWQFVSRVTGLFFPSDLLYSNPGITLMIDSFGGVPRINGPFSEASALANYLSGVVFSCLWLSVRGHRLFAPRLLLILAVFTVLASTSTTGIVTVVLGIPAVLLFATGTVDRQSLNRIWSTIGVFLVASLLLIGPLLVLMPQLLDAVGLIIDGTLSKGSSSSYAERSAHDADALAAVLDTYGLGVGWGGFRSSSLLPGILANGGVVGLLLLLWFVLRTVWVARRSPAGREGAAATPRAHEGQIAVDGFGAALCGQLAAALLSAPMLTSLAFFLQLSCLLGAAARIRIDRHALSASSARALAAIPHPFGHGAGRPAELA